MLYGKQVLQRGFGAGVARRKKSREGEREAGSRRRGIPECESHLYLGHPTTALSHFSHLHNGEEPSSASHRLVLSSGDGVQGKVIRDWTAQ